MSAHRERTLVYDFLTSNNLLHAYASFLGISRSHLKEFLESNTALKNKDLAALYAFSGLTPSDFGVERKMKFFTDKVPDQYDFMSFNEWVIQNNEKEEYSEGYFDKILEKVALAKKRIFIFDYFINHEEFLSGEQRKVFFRGIDNYFNEVENQVNSNQLHYTRVIGLPSDLSSVPHFLLQSQEIEKIKYITFTISILFEKTFEHLCRQFARGTLKLFVLPISPRNYSIMLIDEAFVLTEYFRNRKDGTSVPDLLFVNKAGINKLDHARRLMKVYDREFTELIEKGRAIYVDADLFASCTYSLLEKSQTELSKLQKQSRNPEEILQRNKLQEWEAAFEAKCQILQKYDLR